MLHHINYAFQLLNIEKKKYKKLKPQSPMDLFVRRKCSYLVGNLRQKVIKYICLH